MSNENEEKLTPFQLARRNFMNQGNNNPQPKPIQRSKTISGNIQAKPVQNNPPTNTQQPSQDSEEKLTPFQLARRNFIRNQSSDQLPVRNAAPTKPAPPPQNQQIKEEPKSVAPSPLQQKQPVVEPKPIAPSPIEQQQSSSNQNAVQQERPLLPGHPLSMNQKSMQQGQPQSQPLQQQKTEARQETQQKPLIPGQPLGLQQKQQPKTVTPPLDQQQKVEEPKPITPPPAQQPKQPPVQQPPERPQLVQQPQAQPQHQPLVQPSPIQQPPEQPQPVQQQPTQPQQFQQPPVQHQVQQQPFQQPPVQHQVQQQPFQQPPAQPQVVQQPVQQPEQQNEIQSSSSTPFINPSNSKTLDPRLNSNNISPSRQAAADSKGKNKGGLFKKWRANSLTSSSASNFEIEASQAEPVEAPAPLHVASTIQVSSAPSTASLSNEFLKVPDARSVSLKDVYNVRKIKIESYPSTYRFFSLSDKELASLPWLANIREKQTDNFIFPGEFAQMQPTEMECHSEFDIQSYEPENNLITPLNYKDKFDNPLSVEFKSNPFIDLNAKSVINSIVFPYVREESRMGFLHLKNIYMDQASAERFGMPLTIHGFVYADKVITETFLIKMKKDFSGCEGFLSSMNAPGGADSIIIPYPLNKPAYLVLSLLLDDSTCEESPGSSFAFGKYLLPKDTLPERIEFSFCAGMTNETLATILKEPSNIPMKFIAEAALVEAPVPQSTLRLTAFSDMTPTPVFSLYDIAIRMNLKISSSKDKICFSVRIKKLIPDSKSPEPREVCGFLDFKTGKMVDLAYSALRDYSENIIFHEPINFIFDSSMVDPIEIILTTFTLKKKKLNPIMVSRFQIKNSDQRHVNKMEVKGSLIADMKSAFSKHDNMLSCSTLYPSLVSLNNTLRASFSNPINDPILTDPMFKNIATYLLIQKFLNIQNLPRASFYELFNIIRMSNMAETQNWIDHYFSPEKGFTVCLINRLIESLDIIKDWPQPFFSLVFKGICSENCLYEIENLLNAIVNCKHDTIKKSTGDILLQIPLFFDIKDAHKIAFRFINQLNIFDRFFIFKYIFSDILYIESLTLLNFQIEGKKPRSPYVPLLSLFYSTITNAFVENNADSVGAVSFTLSVLATSLETYLDYQNAKHVATILFPLISIIFTFYDSLSVKLEKKNSLLPILLFIMKYSDKYQFMQYYQLLSSDNKPRFFEFLTILFDNAMINSSPENNAPIDAAGQAAIDKNTALKMTDVARNTFFFNNHPLNCVYEITCRFLVFLSHFESDVNCDEQIKSSIITLLLHMLSPIIQPSESYGMLYQTLASFIKIFVESVYIKETGLINQLFASIIPLTQRKLLYVRMQSIGFIIWLMEKEKDYRSSMSRCSLALQYAVCHSVFELNQVYCYPFWNYLPENTANIKVLYESLVQSISDPLIEKKVMKLLDLYKKFANFPSVRGRIYLKIVDINILADNMISAFATQWKFCGFLAEVLKLQNVVIPGIPTNGYKDFPFIVDELPIDLSVFPPDSRYLVTKSDLFTPESVENALIKAFNLAMKANLYWLIGDVTQFIFDYLENLRKYSILNKLYEQVSLSYQKMQENDQPRIQFARIFVKGKSVEKLGFTDAIHPYPSGRLQDYIHQLFIILEGIGNVDIEVEPRFESKKENTCQVVQVYPVVEELLGLNAKTFTCDVFENFQNWNDIMVKRYTFYTETPLPSSIPTVKTTRHEIKGITKKDYYIEKLTKLRDDLALNTELMKRVIPPKEMIEKWKQYMNGLSPRALISLMDKVFDEQNKNNRIYNIVYTLKKYDPSFALKPLDPSLKQTPEEILDLCNDIWQLMIDAVPVIDVLNYLNTDPEEEKERAKIVFLNYRRLLGMPMV